MLTESLKLRVLPESVGSWVTMPWTSTGLAPWCGLRSAAGCSTVPALSSPKISTVTASGGSSDTRMAADRATRNVDARANSPSAVAGVSSSAPSIKPVKNAAAKTGNRTAFSGADMCWSLVGVSTKGTKVTKGPFD